MRENGTQASNMLVGMAAGAAIGAAGMMMMSNSSQRQLKRTARRMAKGAENAMMQVEKLVGDLIDDRK